MVSELLLIKLIHISSLKSIFHSESFFSFWFVVLLLSNFVRLILLHLSNLHHNLRVFFLSVSSNLHLICFISVFIMVNPILTYSPYAWGRGFGVGTSSDNGNNGAGSSSGNANNGGTLVLQLHYQIMLILVIIWNNSQFPLIQICIRCIFTIMTNQVCSSSQRN